MCKVTQAKILIIENIIIYVCTGMIKLQLFIVKMEISNYLILKLHKRTIFFFVLFEFLKTWKNLKRNRLTERLIFLCHSDNY